MGAMNKDNNDAAAKKDRVDKAMLYGAGAGVAIGAGAGSALVDVALGGSRHWDCHGTQ